MATRSLRLIIAGYLRKGFALVAADVFCRGLLVLLCVTQPVCVALCGCSRRQLLRHRSGVIRPALGAFAGRSAVLIGLNLLFGIQLIALWLGLVSAKQPVGSSPHQPSRGTRRPDLLVGVGLSLTILRLKFEEDEVDAQGVSCVLILLQCFDSGVVLSPRIFVEFRRLACCPNPGI